MSNNVKLKTGGLTVLREMNPAMISYNIEMTEVSGGTFWRAYTPGQIAGTEEVPAPDFRQGFASMHQWYDPIDTTNPRLIKLAKELGPVWIRVSGTWATKTYYDFDGTGITPEGYQSRLTKEQWINLLNFVKAVGGRLLISVSNCEGLHSADEPWNPSEAEKIFALSAEHGVPISAVEFTNEPNMMEMTGFPKGYTPADFRRDQDLFHKWVRANYPDVIVVGPSTCDADALAQGMGGEAGGAGIADIIPSCTTGELLDGCTEPLDVFSYHYYNGVSERMEPLCPSAYTPPSEATSEQYLGMAGLCARAFAPYRDKYCPGAEMWVTESGDAGAGGHTWASTYLEVQRTLNEFGSFSAVTNGVIFHNTLASSDYGYLQHGTFEPRPSYFAALLWNKVMGLSVLDAAEPIREGAHVYAHSRADGKDGIAYLVINNSKTEATTVELPKDAVKYYLDGNGDMRSKVMYLNGKPLTLGEGDTLPSLDGECVKAGSYEIAPGACCFFVI
ncbi:MAG: beta-glucuronidase [Clostridia bacterium]|nr:beta-glucuronidase [Clostridia bacterium]